MQNELQTILRRKVDLITKRALERSPNWIIRKEILGTAKTIYSEKEAMHAT